MKHTITMFIKIEPLVDVENFGQRAKKKKPLKQSLGKLYQRFKKK